MVKFNLIVCDILLVCALLCGRSVSEDVQYFIPDNIANFLSMVRWGILVTVCVFIIPFQFKRYRQYYVAFYRRYFIFYFMAALISLFTGNIYRVVGTAYFFATVPVFVAHTVSLVGIKRFLKHLFYITMSISIFGLFAFMAMRGFGSRYCGWVGNPNNFVMINIFFIVIAMATYFQRILPNNLLYPYLIFLVFMQLAAGSRNGLVILMIAGSVFLVNMKFNYFKIAGILLSVLVAYFCFQYFASDLSRERLFTLSTAISDTGRATIWEDEYGVCIKERPWFGWGCNAQQVNGITTAAHSSYILLLLFFGVPFGMAFGLFYLYSCLRAFFVYRRVNAMNNQSAYMLIGSFLLIFPVSMFGEEIIFGIGNPVYLELYFVMGVLLCLFTSERRAVRILGNENNRLIQRSLGDRGLEPQGALENDDYSEELLAEDDNDWYAQRYRASSQTRDEDDGAMSDGTVYNETGPGRGVNPERHHSSRRSSRKSASHGASRDSAYGSAHSSSRNRSESMGTSTGDLVSSSSRDSRGSFSQKEDDLTRHSRHSSHHSSDHGKRTSESPSEHSSKRLSERSTKHTSGHGPEKVSESSSKSSHHRHDSSTNQEHESSASRSRAHASSERTSVSDEPQRESRRDSERESRRESERESRRGSLRGSERSSDSSRRSPEGSSHHSSHDHSRHSESE